MYFYTFWKNVANATFVWHPLHFIQNVFMQCTNLNSYSHTRLKNSRIYEQCVVHNYFDNLLNCSLRVSPLQFIVSSNAPDADSSSTALSPISFAVKIASSM